MDTSDLEKERQEQELRIQRHIAFAAGFFQGDVTVRTLLESLVEGVIIIDSSGTILLVNTSAEQMFGYSKNELIGKPQTVLIPERVRKVHQEHEAHFFAEPMIRPMGRHLDLAGRRRDGSEFPVEISLNYIETINGIFSLAFVSDITGRKKTEDVLRFNEARYRALFRDNPTMIVTLDADFTMLSVNLVCTSQLGYMIDELEGQSVLKLFHEDDRTAVAEQLRFCLQNPNQVNRWQFRKIRKDGSLLWVEETAQAVYDLDGALNLLVVCQDVTERKRMEDALRESEERYRSLYNDTPVMLHSIDRDWRLVSVSNYWLETLGYERNEVLGRIFTEFLTAASCSYATEIVLPEFFRTGTVKEVPYQIIKKNGEILDVQLSAIAEQDSEGEVVRSLAVMVDVTERKRAEEEIVRLNVSLTARAVDLEYANRELEAFNYTVAHDLRNPLNVISSYCQVIMEMCSANLGEQCMRYIQETYDGTLRMNRLIEALLNFSRLTHAELNRNRVDLSSMAKEVVEELKGTETARRVEIRIADGIVANGDAILLRVVLANLLDNAWKYTVTREEAVLEFGVKEIDGIPVYFVRDNGSGFDNAVAEKIFAPFQRLPGNEKCRGSGIGLATVERIIRRHGGRVCAEGEPNKGATFYFTLLQ